MIKIKKPDIKIIMFLIIAIILILNASSVFWCNEPIKIYVCSLVGLVSMLFLGMNVITNNKLKVNQILMLGIYIAVAGVYLLLRNAGTMISIWILGFGFPYFFVLCFLLENASILKSLIRVLVMVITLLGVVSLYYYLGASLGFIAPTNYVVLNWGGILREIASYNNLYFVPQRFDTTILGIHINSRNCSIFSEAPASSFVFCTALLLNEFCVHIKKSTITPILLITIFSTMSASGWIVIVLFLVYKLSQVKVHSRGGVIFKYLILGALVICAGFLILQLFGDKIGTASGTIRLDKMTNEFEAFRRHILLGEGFLLYTTGSSNSLTALLADGGIILWCIYYIPLVFISLVDLLHWKKINCCILLFYFMFMISAYQYTLFVVFMISVLWVTLLKKLRLIKECNIREYNYIL